MPRDYDDDRPKKSWRDIDKQRDTSQHRKDDQGGNRQSRTQRSQAYRSYKSQLNRLFDGGALPEALKDKLEGSGVASEATQRKQAAQAILDAAKPRSVLAALKSYRDQFGFPEEEEVLTKLLDLSDEDVVLESVKALAQLHDDGKLKRSSSLKGRLKTVQMTLDEPDIVAAAKALLRKL